MKELKKMKKQLIAKQQALSEKTEKLQELMDRLEKLWKTPVDYQELLVLSKKEDLYPLNW
jgi:predicted transcriptional regulator